MNIPQLSVIALLAGSLPGYSSLISWTSTAYTVNGSFGQFLDTGLFDTSGTEILAENIGGGATSFDGINFAAGSTTFTGTFNGFHDTNVPSPDLSRDGTFGTASADTVSLSGLTSGFSYRIQALVFDGRGDVGIPGRTVDFDGIDQGQYANGVSGSTWGDGLLVTGTFTADAASQDFTIEAFDGATSKGGQLNALLVHQTATAVPEASEALVVLLGMTGLLGARRRGRHLPR